MRIIGRNEALILGYGLYRSHTDEPWFRAGELNEALPVNEMHPHKPIPKASYTLVRSRLKEKGMIETSPGESIYPGAPSSDRFTKLTKDGEEYLVEGAIYVVRNKGLTIPALLEIPASIEAFLRHTDFETRLMRVITGMGREAISAGGV